MPQIACPKCQHPITDHNELAGCLREADTGYCPCPLTHNAIRDTARSAGLAEGRERATEGAAAAGTTSPGAIVTEWRVKAADALNALIQSGVAFTADDLVERAGMPPVPNMVGAVFMAARRQGRITAMGYTQATRPESHARVQRVWVAP